MFLRQNSFQVITIQSHKSPEEISFILHWLLRITDLTDPFSCPSYSVDCLQELRLPCTLVPLMIFISFLEFSTAGRNPEIPVLKDITDLNNPFSYKYAYCFPYIAPHNISRRNLCTALTEIFVSALLILYRLAELFGN